MFGEEVKSFVVPKDGMNITPEEIVTHCANYLPKTKVPKFVEFRTELPKTMVGKILRRVLVEEELQRLQQQG